MAELPDVIGGETITSDWGNDIRDRAVMRYANTAARSSEHPSPSPGDLAFLEDTGLVYVYFAGAWHTVYEGQTGSAVVRFGFDQDAVSDTALSSTWETGATVTFSKPSTWAGYDLMAWGMVTFLTLGDTGVPGSETLPRPAARITIGSSSNTAMSLNSRTVASIAEVPFSIPVAYTRSLVSSETVSIQYSQVVNTVRKVGSSVQYIATRTS